jgi:hypothetical protein
VLTDQNNNDNSHFSESFQVANINYQEFVADLSAYNGELLFSHCKTRVDAVIQEFSLTTLLSKRYLLV